LVKNLLDASKKIADPQNEKIKHIILEKKSLLNSMALHFFKYLD